MDRSRRSATFCGLAGDGLGFFHIPVDGAKPTIPPDHVSATALVTILEGEVSVELLKSELARILPVKWDWEVHEHGDKAYVVPFPCKIELDRMVAIGSVTTKLREGVLLFEEYNTEIKPTRKLEQVWVRVFGVPYEIRSFLLLWAVGTWDHTWGYSKGRYYLPDEDRSGEAFGGRARCQCCTN